MKILIFLVLVSTFTFAKKDFYYSFINDDKKQINYFQKKQIIEGYHKIEYIKRLVREGQLQDAYDDIIRLKLNNKIKVLNSSIILLYAEILYKRDSKKFAILGANLLEKAVNGGKINEADLLNALRLLVKLELKINKIVDARFYAKAILESFDNPLAQAYGKIAQAQIATHRRKYKASIKILYKILVKTNNMEVATVVADELYDVYVLNHQDKKAYDLATKVLQKNIAYYANDSFLALRKVDKLIKADMPYLAIKILKMLLDNATQQQSIATFKFKLANAYMSIKTLDPKYMLKAKELYKDLVSSKRNNPYKKIAKKNIDEILMREGKLLPSLIVRKYPHSEVMQEKALLQELLTQASKHKYDEIIKLKKVYNKISDTTARRFGYNSIKDVFVTIDSQMIEYYLKKDDCLSLTKVLKSTKKDALKRIIKNHKENNEMFECLLEYPSRQTFNIAYKTFNDSENGNIYLYLERIALQLNLIDDALKLSQDLDLVKKDKDKYKSEEFLYRFLIYTKQDNQFSMQKFFDYAQAHKNYIRDNQNKPMIIDFYYQYYLYLLNKNKNKEAINILNKLYRTQLDMGAFVYSPFVEMELASESVLDDDYKGALNYLELAIDHPRIMKPNDLVQIYFEMAKVYKKLGKVNRYKDTIDKCKSVEGAKSIYKDMCEKL